MALLNNHLNIILLNLFKEMFLSKIRKNKEIYKKEKARVGLEGLAHSLIFLYGRMKHCQPFL